MAKKFGEVVSLVRGDETVNALVVQSVQQKDGEHLTVVYLDPAKASPLLSGQNVDAAIKRDFVTPLTEGKTFGWKELGSSVQTTASSDPVDFDAALKTAAVTINGQADKIENLEKELSDLKAELTAAQGVDKQLQAIEDATKAKDATDLADEALGKPDPGDPDSPHKI